jgi:NYN domain
MDNHFYVDGSALLADLKRVRQNDGTLLNRRLDLLRVAAEFAGFAFHKFLSDGFRRFTYYFVNGDPRIEKDLLLPDFTMPGAVEDLRIEFCGKRIRELEVAREWLDTNNAPSYVKECVHRTEKAVDTKICADALQLAAVGKLDRLFLYSNDYDFVPLCRALRNLGRNVNLLRLQPLNINIDLVEECDALHCLESSRLQYCFVPPVS